jgi:hypothetical protein
MQSIRIFFFLLDFFGEQALISGLMVNENLCKLIVLFVLNKFDELNLTDGPKNLPKIELFDQVGRRLANGRFSSVRCAGCSESNDMMVRFED